MIRSTPVTVRRDFINVGRLFNVTLDGCNMTEGQMEQYRINLHSYNNCFKIVTPRLYSLSPLFSLSICQSIKSSILLGLCDNSSTFINKNCEALYCAHNLHIRNIHLVSYSLCFYLVSVLHLCLGTCKEMYIFLNTLLQTNQVSCCIFLDKGGIS